MIITNVTGSYFLKQNDTATKMRLFISEADGVTPVDLAKAIRLEVIIGVPEGRVLVKTPTILEEPGQLEFGLDDGDLLPTGDDRLEVHVFYAENMKRVAPSKGYYKLRIQEPIDELSVEVTTYTLDYFLAEVNRMTGNIPAIAEQANTLIEELNIAIPLVTQASIDAEQAAQTALTASNNAATANATFDAVIPLAQSATTAATQATTAANNAATSASNAAFSANNAASAANAAASMATTAGTNAQVAADIANSTVESLEDLQDDLTGYSIPITDFTLNTAFLKGQTARFNGSTYRAKVVTQGNPLPPSPAVENEWWTLVAQRGVDGEGAVGSVNGILPDASGNVDVPVPEPTWNTVVGKPTVFPPSSHTHPWSEVTNKPTEFTPEAHTHTWDQVTNKPTMFTPASHTHPIAQVEELQETIDNINMSIDAIGQTGIPKLATYQYVVPATSNGQTQIEVPLDTFNVGNDTLFLYRNRTAQEPTAFSVTNTTITLNEPVTDYVNTSFHIRILKNVPIGPAGSIDASVLLNGSIDEDKLSSAVTTKLNAPGFSGNYNDLTNKPNIPAPYTLPTASTTVTGGIKVDGTTITVNPSTGVASASGSNIDTSDFVKKDGTVAIDHITIGTRASGSTIGANSFAQGSGVISSGFWSHAEGGSTTASGQGSHAEGGSTTASGFYAHAEGNSSMATGNTSHAQGSNTMATGSNSHSQGSNTRASDFASHAQGSYNKAMSGNATAFSSTNTAFVIGNGANSSALSNAFRVTFAGATYGLSAFNSSGADYAEYFEWLDGNVENEDRVGQVVTLEGDKVRKANETDTYILGIVSANPSIIGDSYQDDWSGKYLLDEWGRIQYHYVGEEYLPIHNPNWDSNEEYIPREERKEWDAIGLMGKLYVRDDGTCQVNGYATIGTVDGEVTASNGPTNMRVIERSSSNIVRVYIK